MRNNPYISKQLACAHWLDTERNANKYEKRSIGEIVSTNRNVQAHKIIRVLGNHLLLENMKTKEQSVIHVKDTEVIANTSKGVASMLKHYNKAVAERNSV